MFLMEVEADFEAGHRLPGYNGPCRRAHGHSYVVWATWGTNVLDDQGIAIDLTVLKKMLRLAVQPLDHQSLNQVMAGHTTAECIARLIWNKLRLQNFGSSLHSVAVQETRGTKVTFTGE